MPFIDVTAATMLAQLVADLERTGVQLVLARDIGQVRDLIRLSQAGDLLRAYRRSTKSQSALRTLTETNAHF